MLIRPLRPFRVSIVTAMSQMLDIVRLQGFRGQFRITIPHEMVAKLKWQKGQPLFISVESDKIVVEQVVKK